MPLRPDVINDFLVKQGNQHAARSDGRFFLGHQAMALLADRKIKRKYNKPNTFVVAGEEDLDLLLKKLKLQNDGDEAFIFYRPLFHSQALYLKKVDGELKAFFSDSQQLLDSGVNYYPNKALVKTLVRNGVAANNIFLTTTKLQNDYGCSTHAIKALRYCAKHDIFSQITSADKSDLGEVAGHRVRKLKPKALPAKFVKLSAIDHDVDDENEVVHKKDGDVTYRDYRGDGLTNEERLRIKTEKYIYTDLSNAIEEGGFQERDGSIDYHKVYGLVHKMQGGGLKREVDQKAIFNLSLNQDVSAKLKVKFADADQYQFDNLFFYKKTGITSSRYDNTKPLFCDGFTVPINAARGVVVNLKLKAQRNDADNSIEFDLVRDDGSAYDFRNRDQKLQFLRRFFVEYRTELEANPRFLEQKFKDSFRQIAAIDNFCLEADELISQEIALQPRVGGLEISAVSSALRYATRDLPNVKVVNGVLNQTLNGTPQDHEIIADQIKYLRTKGALPQYLVFPMSSGFAHQYAVVVDTAQRKIRYSDSIGARREDELSFLTQAGICDGYTFQREECPYQANGSSCGFNTVTNVTKILAKIDRRIAANTDRNLSFLKNWNERDASQQQKYTQIIRNVRLGESEIGDDSERHRTNYERKRQIISRLEKYLTDNATILDDPKVTRVQPIYAALLEALNNPSFNDRVDLCETSFDEFCVRRNLQIEGRVVTEDLLKRALAGEKFATRPTTSSITDDEIFELASQFFNENYQQLFDERRVLREYQDAVSYLHVPADQMEYFNILVKASYESCVDLWVDKIISDTALKTHLLRDFNYDKEGYLSTICPCEHGYVIGDIGLAKLSDKFDVLQREAEATYKKDFCKWIEYLAEDSSSRSAFNYGDVAISKDWKRKTDVEVIDYFRGIGDIEGFQNKLLKDVLNKAEQRKDLNGFFEAAGQLSGTLTEVEMLQINARAEAIISTPNPPPPSSKKGKPVVSGAGKAANKSTSKGSADDELPKWQFAEKSHEITLESKPDSKVKVTLVAPIVSNENSIWFDASDRGNNFRVVNGVYGQNGIDRQIEIGRTFIGILQKIAKEVGEKLGSKFSKDQVLAIIDAAKERGGVSNKLDLDDKKYLSQEELEKAENQFDEIAGVRPEVAKYFSGRFQQECEKCGIYTGREGVDAKMVGLRLTFIPDDLVDFMRNNKVEDRTSVVDSIQSKVAEIQSKGQMR
jgi:hypothetical protein